MPRLELRLPPELHDHILKQKPKTLSLSAFCALLLEQNCGLGLDSASRSPLQPPVRGANKDQVLACLPAEENDPLDCSVVVGEGVQGEGSCDSLVHLTTVPVSKISGIKLLRDTLALPEFDYCRDLALDFWNSKKGGKSAAAAKLLLTGLRQIYGKYGPQAVLEQLEQGIACGWKSITLKNYETFALPRRSSMSSSIEREHEEHRKFLEMFGGAA